MPVCAGCAPVALCANFRSRTFVITVNLWGSRGRWRRNAGVFLCCICSKLLTIIIITADIAIRCVRWCVRLQAQYVHWFHRIQAVAGNRVGAYWVVIVNDQESFQSRTGWRLIFRIQNLLNVLLTTHNLCQNEVFKYYGTVQSGMVFTRKLIGSE